MVAQVCSQTPGKNKWFLGMKCGTNSDQIIIWLNQNGIFPHVIPIKNEENALQCLPPGELVQEMSEDISREVSEILAGELAYDLIIAFDTVIVVDGDIIGKPKDADDALSILSRLNNRWHSVFSGVTLLDANKRMKKFHVETKIKFGDIPAKKFRKYVKTGECFNQLGAYNSQGSGSSFIESFDGTLNDAVGFPVQELQIKLQEFLLGASGSTAENVAPLPVSIEKKKDRPIPKPRRLPPSKPVECHDMKDEDQPSAKNENQPSVSTEGKSATGGALKSAPFGCFDEPWTSRKMFPNQRIIIPPRVIDPSFRPMTLEEIYNKIHGRHRYRAQQQNPQSSQSSQGTRLQGPRRQFQVGQYPQVPRPQFNSPQLQSSQQLNPRPQFRTPQPHASQQFRPRQQLYSYQQNQRPC